MTHRYLRVVLAGLILAAVPATAQPPGPPQPCGDQNQVIAQYAIETAELRLQLQVEKNLRAQADRNLALEKAKATPKAEGAK